MKFQTPVSVEWIANLIAATVVGDSSAQALGINEIHRVENGDLCFVDHPKYYTKCLQSAASFVIINAEVEERYGKTLLICEEPFEAYLKIVRHFRKFEPATQLISESATIGSGTVIMPGAFIGNNVVIGDDCIIYPNVVIYDHCVIGHRVKVHAGTSIGADAFYYNTKKNRSAWYKKMESCGRVLLHDDVEVGANTCIDRGVTHDTTIGAGTKIDNLVQIGHDVVIGTNCIIAAQVGIAGATVVGNGVSIWGQAGINKTITIADGAVILGQTGVAANLAGNKTYWGTPAIEAVTKHRQDVWIKRIPEMWEKIKNL